MRSPWLSREYKKANDIEIVKKKDEVILKNKKYKTELKLTHEEFENYNTGNLNEIEWEKYFFKGFAIDKNYEEHDFNSVIDLSKKVFIKSPKVKVFPLKTKNEKYMILINPELGSWIALDD